MYTLSRVPAVVVSLCAGSASMASLVYLPTNVGNGADAEVRESNPTQNRGNSTEIATRVKDYVPSGDANDGSDRNSVIYLQFDLATLGPVSTSGATLRMTFRNNNLSEQRIFDTDNVNPNYGVNGFRYYGIPGATFDEGTITYNTAPGITPDGDVGTADFNGGAQLLGEQDLYHLHSANWLAVGSAFDFQSGLLDTFLASEMKNNPNGVAVIAVVHRNQGLVTDQFSTKGGDEPQAWSNFNYLFNPKEQTTLNSDPSWDSDINDPNNPTGSPWSGADNSTGLFSPQLIFLPSPGAAAVFGVIGVAVVRRRR